LERGPVAPRQVDATHRSGKQHVAREEGAVAAPRGGRTLRSGALPGGVRGAARLARGRDRVGEVTGTVSWRVDDLDVHAGEVQALASGERVVGLVALKRAETR